MKQIIPTEHQEAVSLTQWLEYQKNLGKIACFTHVPNETYTTSWKQKTKNKNEGVRRGVPDYLIVLKHKILFIELKRTKYFKISKEQFEWINAINATKQAKAKVCKGCQECMDFVLEHIS